MVYLCSFRTNGVIAGRLTSRVCLIKENPMRRQSISCCLFAALLILIAFTSNAAAATITVDTNDDDFFNNGNCSIREAFASANQDFAYDACTAGSGDDVIELPGGEIVLDNCFDTASTDDFHDDTGPHPYDGSMCDDLELSDNTVVNGNGTVVSAGNEIVEALDGTENFYGHYRVLRIDDRTEDAVTSEDHESEPFVCEAPLTVTLNNFTIQDGISCNGGGIANYAADLTLNNMNVINNHTSYSYCNGAGIYSQWNLTLNNSNVSDNTGYHARGGGIYIEAHEGCVYEQDECSDNSICEEPASTAQAIKENPTFTELTLNNSHVDNNCFSDETILVGTEAANDYGRCNYGGGIYAQYTNLNMTNGSTVNSNEARYGGGGMYWYVGNINIDGSNVDKNIAGHHYYSGNGGAIYWYGLGEGEFYRRQEYCDHSEDDDSRPRAHEEAPPLAERTLSIKNSTVNGNRGEYEAGAIHASHGHLSITDSTVDGNTSGYMTGGIDYRGMFDVCTGEFIGKFDLIGSTVSNNEAPFTGGIANHAGLFSCTNSTISTNSALMNGGGGYYQSAFGGRFSSSASSATAEGLAEAEEAPHGKAPSLSEMIDEDFSGENFADVVFGLFNNCTIHLNSSDTITELFHESDDDESDEPEPYLTCEDSLRYSPGGGVSIAAGRATFENTAVAGNTDRGACDSYEPDTMDDSNMSQGIIFNPEEELLAKFAPDGWVNDFVCPEDEDMDDDTSKPRKPKICFFFIPASAASEGYTLIGNNSGFPMTPATGDQIGTNDSPIDPLLGPLQDNGGTTFTHAPELGSPMIDGGSPAIGAAGQLRVAQGCAGDDQRDVPRPQQGTPTGEPRCDIGAIEAQFDFACTTSDLAPLQLQLDGGISRLERMVKRATRIGRRAGLSRKVVRNLRNTAAALYLAGWTATWVDLPSDALACAGNTGNLCVNASTSSATNGYISASDELRKLANKAFRKAKKKGARVKLRRKKKQSQSIHDSNVSSSTGVPADILHC